MKKTLVLLILLLTSFGSYAYDACIDGVYYNFSSYNNTATVTCLVQNSDKNASAYIGDVVIPETVLYKNVEYTVTTISNSAFYYCRDLTSISIPSSVTSIGGSVFSGCSSLTSIVVENGNTKYDSRNGCNAIIETASNTLIVGCKNTIIPNSVTSIGRDAFYGCTGLTSIEIPNSVTSIGFQAFSGCSGLTSVTIPNSVTSLANDAFAGCSNLTSVLIGSGVASIGDNVFRGCSSLTSVYIGSGVSVIGYNVFYNCNFLSDIHFASSTPQVTYSWPSTATLYIPDEAVDAYRAAWTDYAQMVVPESSFTRVYQPVVTAREKASAVVEAVGEDEALNVVNLKVTGSINGYDLMVFRNKMVNLRVLDLSEATVESSSYKYYENYYSKDNVITGYFAPSTVVTLKLPQGITALEDYAFSGCSLLRSITLPEGITDIPYCAFSGCSSLTAIAVPESVTMIDSFAFGDCSNLTTISLPEGITSIGSCAFIRCTKLTSIYLPKTLQDIGSSAFENTGLTEMHLPPYLKTIGRNAFTSSSNLNTIYAYMPDIVNITTSTFTTYQTASLYVPEFLYNNYYYDTQWSQFLNVMKTNLNPDDYITLPANGDIVFEDGDERIPDTSDGEHIDGEVGDEGGVTVIGDDPQPFDEVDQDVDGDGTGGSLIGDDDGENQGNLPVNRLRVRITVQPNRWYFFCFPWDVIISECTYPGQYVWRQYDGLIRAMQGANGWQPVTGDRLEALHGYIFQSSKGGKLILTFDHPTFGGDRPINLTPYITGNKQDESWNFVGNPYSCYYDFQEDDYSAPITVWNGSSYQAYRPGDDDYHLRPYEAFFVQKPANTEQIGFEPERRETYLRSQATAEVRREVRRARGIDPKRQLVNLQIMDSEGQQLDRTRVVINNEASTAYELECDAAKFMSNDAQAQLYSLESGVAMSINERSLQGDIRLGYIAKKAGTLSISAPRMDKPMVLIDTEMGTTFDLTLGNYDFQTKAGTNNTRFLLRENAEATGIGSLAERTGVVIGTQQGGLAIGGAEGKTVNVFTTSGAQAGQHTGNGFIALQRGIYVVEVDGQSAKIAVK